MCQCTFITAANVPSWWGVDDKGGSAWGGWGGGGLTGISVLSSQCSCEPKTAVQKGLKKSVSPFSLFLFFYFKCDIIKQYFVCMFRCFFCSLPLILTCIPFLKDKI